MKFLKRIYNFFCPKKVNPPMLKIWGVEVPAPIHAKPSYYGKIKK